MKNTAIIRNFWFGSFMLLLLCAASSSAQLVRTVKSSTPVNMGVTVALFRQDLGGVNNNNGGTHTSGYREINWEDTPEYPGLNGLFDYYNTAKPRGVILNPIQRNIGSWMINISRDNFAEYHTDFQPYSGNTIFSPIPLTFLDISFVVPGTDIPASVNGFGIVFTDIDLSGYTWVCLYDEKGEVIKTLVPDAINGGLTFIGASFTNGKRISRVSIRTGTTPLDSSADEDGFEHDKVAIDNIIFGEPRAIEHHKSDFDGDGATDTAVFRPSEGKWYVMHSGTNTFSQLQFGAPGDVPVDGDFDGDARSDFTVFRPSTGTWYTLRSSDLQTQGVQFGQNGDKPVAGDYDKDGKTDYAVWRSGTFWILQSSNGESKTRQFGVSGDIPIGAAVQ